MNTYLDKRWKNLPECSNVPLSDYALYASFHAKDGSLWLVYRGATADGRYFLVKTQVKALNRKRYDGLI